MFWAGQNLGPGPNAPCLIDSPPLFKLMQLLFFIQFVAHHHSQLILDTVVYSEFPINFTKVPLLDTLLLYNTLLFPIWVVIFLFVPNCKMSKWMKTPYAKFVGQVSQFFIFLILLVLSAFRNSHMPSAVGKHFFTEISTLNLQLDYHTSYKLCFLFFVFNTRNKTSVLFFGVINI